MNWNWLTRYFNLLADNKRLREQVDAQLKLMSNFYNVNKYNIIHAEQIIQNIRQEEVSLLGGIALQHQGEILIKNDFIQMLTSPDYNLQVVIERSEEKEGVYVRVMEVPVEDKKKEEEDVEDKK